MASNAFANVAAAVAAGYTKTNTDRGIQPSVNPAFTPSERFMTVFTLAVSGAAGEPGMEIRQTGYGPDQNTAELNALAALNFYRANRYGGDSAAANAASTNPATKDAASASKKHTKDST